MLPHEGFYSVQETIKKTDCAELHWLSLVGTCQMFSLTPPSLPFRVDSFRAPRNLKCMLWLPTFANKVPFERRDTWWSIIYVHMPVMNILGGFDVRCRQFKAAWTNFWTQNQSEQNGKPVQLPEFLWQYHVHRGPKQQFVVEEVTRMDTNGCDMVNDNFTPFLGNGGCGGSTFGQI